MTNLGLHATEYKATISSYSLKGDGTGQSFPNAVEVWDLVAISILW